MIELRGTGMHFLVVMTGVSCRSGRNGAGFWIRDEGLGVRVRRVELG